MKIDIEEDDGKLYVKTVDTVYGEDVETISAAMFIVCFLVAKGEFVPSADELECILNDNKDTLKRIQRDIVECFRANTGGLTS